MSFLTGEQVVLTNTFTVAAVNTDPTTISLAVTTPAGVTTTYTYAAAEITKTAVGVYTKTITATAAGAWQYVWTGTGTAADIAPGWFQVTAVVAPGAPDPTDVLTLEEAKRALNMTDTSQDVEVAGYITAVSRRLDELAGAVVVRTVTGEAHSGGRGRVTLDYRPVVSVTSISEYVLTTATVLTAETNAVKPSAGYAVDLRWGDVHRRASGGDSVFPAGVDNVVVTYVAGRAATTSVVDAKFKQAAAICLSHWWRLEQGAGSVTFGAFTDNDGALPAGFGFAVPNRALELISADLAPPACA